MNGMDLAFVIASAIATTSGLLAVTRRNPVYSAVWMMLTMFSVAVIFLLLHSTFLFATQILLYAGAILVLFVFVIMLLNPGPAELAMDRPPAWLRGGAAAFAAVLFVVIARAVYTGEVASGPAFSAPDARPPEPPIFGDTDWFGDTIYVRYVVAFEMISVLIMASIAAVVLLAKRRLEADDADRPPLRKAALAAAQSAADGKAPERQRDLFEGARH